MDQEECDWEEDGLEEIENLRERKAGVNQISIRRGGVERRWDDEEEDDLFDDDDL